MKKLAAILFLTIYAASAVGVTTSYHYCKGHLTQIHFLVNNNKSSCYCDTSNTPKDCCKDELKYQKNDNHGIVKGVSIEDPRLLTIEPLPFTEYHIILLPVDLSLVGAGKFTKRSRPQPIFLLNNVFRI